MRNAVVFLSFLCMLVGCTERRLHIEMGVIFVRGNEYVSFIEPSYVDLGALRQCYEELHGPSDAAEALRVAENGPGDADIRDPQTWELLARPAAFVRSEFRPATSKSAPLVIVIPFDSASRQTAQEIRAAVVQQGYAAAVAETRKVPT